MLGGLSFCFDSVVVGLRHCFDSVVDGVMHKEGPGESEEESIENSTNKNLFFPIYSLTVQDGDDAADAPATFGRRLRSCLYFFVGMIYCFENVIRVWRHCFDSAGDWLLIQ